jgi:short-subunit dehydrogenase
MRTTSLENKIIWLTGASSGIGKAILEQLLFAKAKVIASSRNLDSLHELQLLYPNNLELIPVDVTKLPSVLSCTAEIQANHGLIDIAILNAGNCYYIDIRHFSAATIEKNFAVNFFGICNCIEAALPLLKNSKQAQLIGMSSSSAYIGLPMAEGYGSSKSAARYLLQSLQAHLRSENIAVSIICPGFVKTPLTDQNQFPMPFIIDATKAAKYIVAGIRKSKSEISFPRRLIWLLKLLNILPDNLRIFILSKTVRKL